MLKKISIFMSIIVTMVLLLAIQAAAVNTTAPDVANITITNHLSGTPDTVKVGSALATDVIRVYKAAAGGLPIGATAAGSSATVYINQLGTTEGSVYVTVTSVGLDESDRTLVNYLPESKTTTLAADDISVVNNILGTLDVITVSNIKVNDIVRVYTNSVTSVAIGTVVSTNLTATVYVSQLGTAAGRVYVSVQTPGTLESGRASVVYASETSDSLTASTVTVANNFYFETAGSQDPASIDSITVPGVEPGDIVTVYKSLIGTEVWAGPMTLALGDIVDGEVTINVNQLGTKAGRIYVTITKIGKAESKRASVYYAAEPVSVPPLAASVKVTNNYINDDIVDFTDLVPDDIVTAYNSPVSLTPLGSSTVALDGTASFTISDGILAAAGGKIYVTITTTGANESAKTIVTYGMEDTNKALSASTITVANNYNNMDTVKVTGLAVDDIIRVYATPIATTTIGNATATTDSVLIPLGLTNLSAKGGKIYVSITTAGAAESPRTAVSYAKEDVTAPPVLANIVVTNNYTASDTVTVSGLQEYYVVRVYNALTGGDELGSEAVAAGQTAASVQIDIGELSAKGGKIYVSVQSLVAHESPRTTATYVAEATTEAPFTIDIVVTNNYIISDTIVVSGLAVDDVVTVYTSALGTEVRCSGIATGGELTFTLAPGNLSASGGKVYVAVKKTFANESPRTTIAYSSEKSSTPVAKMVTVVNNYYLEDAGGVQVPGTEDFVTVPDVALGDIITIYKGSGGTLTWVSPVTVTAGNLIGDAVTIPVSQLGSKAGKIYVAVTKLNKSESARAGVSFGSEPLTDSLLVSSVVIDNNYAAEDVVTVNDLTVGQIVTLYTTTSGAAFIDYATATDVTMTFVLEDGVLTAAGGKIYVAVKDYNKLESIRTVQIYTPETTVSPKIADILVVNYPGSAYDTITLVGLTTGDIVTIYNAATGGIELSRATVAGKGTTLTLDTNLPDSGGTIYVTITNDGKAESKRVAVMYYGA